MRAIVAGTSLWLVAVAGCGGGGAADGVAAPPPASVPQFTSVEVTPSAASVVVGATQALAVIARDDRGQPLSVTPQPVFTSANPAVAAVSIAGVVSGVAPGSTSVTVSLTIAGVTRTAGSTITVLASGPPASTATVTTPGTSFNPSNVTVPVGGSVTWSFSGAVHNVTFTGAAPTGGNIPDQAIGSSAARTFAQAGTFAYECTRHAGMRGTVVVQGAAPAVFTALALTPTAPALDVGGTVQLVAVALDQNGSEMPGLPAATFSSANPAVATVSTSGLVSGSAAGTAVITAGITAAGVLKTAQVTVTVTAPSASLAVVTTPGTTFTPATVTIPAGGTVSWRFSGAVHNVTFFGAVPTGGNVPDQLPGNAVDRVFPAAGTYDYECTRHVGMAGRVVVQGVAPAVLTSLGITPATPAIAIGGTVTLAVVPRDQDGNAMTGTAAPAFVSSAPGTASVSTTGVVTGVAAGTATITASLAHGGVTRSAAAVVTVQPSAGANTTISTPNRQFSPATLTVPPNTVVTWQFSEARHNVTFTTTTPTGGNIPDQAPGNAVSRTFVTPGAYAYECTLHTGMSGQVIVQGSAPPVFTTLDLAPSTPTIAVGATVQLAVTPRDQTGVPMTTTAAPAFTSASPSVATVSVTGLVTGASAGTSTITASLAIGGVARTATATVTVQAASPPGGGGATVTTPNRTFAPATVTIPVGGTVTWQFSEAVHNVTFAGAAPTGGNIPDTQPGNAATRTFPVAGTFAYQCTRHTGMDGTVLVQAPSAGGTFTSLRLTANATSIAVGQGTQLVATPLDQNGAPMAGNPAATFSSSATAVATVSAAGFVQGVAPGTAQVSASLTWNGVTRTATVTITVTATGAGATVSTAGQLFTPDDLTIAPGQPVAWQFTETTHNVTFKGTPPPGGSIPDTAPGVTVSRTFTTVGTYDYECTLHKGMKGRVRVQ